MAAALSVSSVMSRCPHHEDFVAGGAEHDDEQSRLERRLNAFARCLLGRGACKASRGDALTSVQ